MWWLTRSGRQAGRLPGGWEVGDLAILGARCAMGMPRLLVFLHVIPEALVDAYTVYQLFVLSCPGLEKQQTRGTDFNLDNLTIIFGTSPFHALFKT
jgi:hypothetical protein